MAPGLISPEPVAINDVVAVASFQECGLGEVVAVVRTMMMKGPAGAGDARAQTQPPPYPRHSASESRAPCLFRQLESIRSSSHCPRTTTYQHSPAEGTAFMACPRNTLASRFIQAGDDDGQVDAATCRSGGTNPFGS